LNACCDAKRDEPRAGGESNSFREAVHERLLGLVIGHDRYLLNLTGFV
jgi:hypothetical protein